MYCYNYETSCTYLPRLVSINSDKNSFSQFPSHLIYSDYKMIAVNFI